MAHEAFLPVAIYRRALSPALLSFVLVVVLVLVLEIENGVSKCEKNRIEDEYEYEDDQGQTRPSVGQLQ